MTKYKMRNSKRWLALTLTIILIVNLLPVQIGSNEVLAASGEERSFVFHISSSIGAVADATVKLSLTSGVGATEVTATTDGAGIAIFSTAIDNAVTEDSIYTYSVTAENYNEKAGTITIGMDDLGQESVTLEFALPVITAEPEAADASFGTESVNFSVTASGLGTLSYQWYKGTVALGNEIDGATDAALTILDVSWADAGNYLCVVTNETGGVCSAAAALTVVQKVASLVLTATPEENATYGDTVLLTATINGVLAGIEATGTVTFKEEGNPISGGESVPAADNKATFSYTMPVAHGTITAEYSGDTNYTAAAAQLGEYSVGLAEQDPIIEPSVLEVTYPDTIDASIASGGTTDAAVTYSILPGGTGEGTLNGAMLTPTKAGTIIISAEKAGDTNYNPVSVQYTITVNPKSVTVTDTAVADKIYDGTNAATFNMTPSLEGVEAGDMSDVELISGTPAFHDINVGNQIVVTFTEFTLTGTKSHNYVIVQPASVKADIKTRTLTVTAVSQLRTYGEDTVKEAIVTGFAQGETEESLAALGYVSPTVSCSIPDISHEKFAASGIYTGIITVSGGTPTSNYVFDYVAGDLTIMKGAIAEGIHYTITAADGENGWFNCGDFVITPKQGETSSYDQIAETEDGSWSDTLIFSEDIVLETIVFYLKDSCTGAVSLVSLSHDYKIDKMKPSDLEITYSTPLLEKVFAFITFGYYNPAVTVTLKAVDITSGVEHFNWTYTKELGASSQNTEIKTGQIDSADITRDGDGTATAMFTLTADEAVGYRGNIVFSATDEAGNTSDEFGDTDDILVVDTISPTRIVTYNSPKLILDAATMLTKSSYTEGSDSILYYDGDVTMTLQIEEANFYSEDIRMQVEKDSGTVYEQAPADWVQTEDSDIWTGTITLSGDGDYIITITYQDRSGNEMAAYTSEKIVIDTIDPIINVSYSPAAAVRTVGREAYYDDAQTATITVIEHNFRADDIAAIITAQNIAGEKVAIFDFASYLKNRSNWTQNGDVYTATITYSVDAHYTFDISYRDLALRKTADYEKDFFLIDTTAANNLHVTYSTPLIGKILQTITFGYYKPSVVVTLTAEDITAGIDYFNWTYTKESGASAANVLTESGQINRKGIVFSNGGKTATATFTLKADAAKQYRGNISFTATDMAGNTSDYLIDSDNIIVVDTVSPTRSVSYNSPKQIVDRTTLLAKAGYTENSNSILYYDGDVVADFRVDEANFYPEDVSIKVTKNGKETYSQLPTNWTQTAKTDKWAGSITLSGDGEYFITMTYTDRSTNKMVTYISEQIIIDTIAPVRVVEFSPSKQVVDADSLLSKSSYIYSEEGTNSILYYDADVTAIFKITEANFYAEDVVIQVNGDAYAPISWTQNGDEWTGIVTFSGDGDYIVTMTYTDRSGNAAIEYTSEKIVIDTVAPVISVSYSPNHVSRQVNGRTYYDAVQTATITVTEHNFRADDIAASITAKDVTGTDIPMTDYAAYLSNRSNWVQDGDTYTAVITYQADANYTFNINYQDLAQHSIVDYAEDLFTVDTTAPTNLSISYSAHLAQATIDSVIMGYYDAPVTVTISAEDNTAGIYNFEYSFIKAAGVSSVNAELIDAAISNAEISFSDSGRRATATFTIPGSALGNNNQFNGTVGFTAYDIADNRTEENDTKRIVVDNIAPIATVTYNNPVQEADGISYYSGDIVATIIINEANFSSEDVNVMVSKDDGEAYSVTPVWDNGNVDIHNGFVTLTDEGDYIMTVSYKDRSNNEMTTHTSKQLTIDTTAPVIQVEGIIAKTAYNDNTISFEINASDINFDVTKFEPRLTAVIRNEDGMFQTFEISMGTMNEITAGKAYSYKIDNLEADGIYSLSCTITDMAGNISNKINLTDSKNKSVEEMAFSVNREGSTFMLDDNSQKLVDTYYMQDVYNNIVVDEINVDPLESYNVMLNNEELSEGSDYIVTKNSGEEEWYRYTYTIRQELFEEEGEYRLVLSSTDKARNTAYSDIKSAEISFMIDRTAPIVTLSGMTSDGRYQVESQTVTIIPRDDGGKLNSLKIIVSDSNNKPIMDEDGKDISVRINLEGEELYRALEVNSNKITFEIPTGIGMNVRIICDDLSRDTVGNTNVYDETFTNITVSTNIFIMYYANKPAFYGSIAGVALISASLFFIISKRRKKKE